MFRASTLLILATLMSSPAYAQTTPSPSADPESPANATAPAQEEFPNWIVGGQMNVIGQHISNFHSPYSGVNSLRSESDGEISELYTLFLGARLAKGLEVYVNPELATGHGLSQGFGAAGYVNGDVIRNPALGGHPYLGRYFLRYTIDTGGEEETAPRQASGNQIGGPRPTDRLVFTLGKFAMNDMFDNNRYANSSRTQFLNWSFITDLAWDFPADTRGYTQGAVVAWEHPDWSVRAGIAQMPTFANGPTLDSFPRARGSVVELEVHPKVLGDDNDPAVIRIMGYHNVASMGNYRDAVQAANIEGVIPDIRLFDRAGNSKYGFTLNFEQPLDDSGETGLFGRYGWSDGANESFAYSECDSTLTFGAQLSGVKWDRPKDRMGFALAQNQIFAPHRDYLKAGGLGFILGDGNLNYGPERVAEFYYWWQMTNAASLTLDLQYLQNPGYNQDRGPVFVPGLRFHIEY